MFFFLNVLHTMLRELSLVLTILIYEKEKQGVGDVKYPMTKKFLKNLHNLKLSCTGVRGVALRPGISISECICEFHYEPCSLLNSL